MEAFLHCSDRALEPQLRYAVEVLLESVGLNTCSVQVKEAGGGHEGLEIDGRCLLGTAELKDIYRRVSLQRELDTGKTDGLQRFDETAATWNTSKPWVDLRAQEFGLQSEVSQDHGKTFQVLFTHDIDRTTTCEPTMVMKGILRSCGLLDRREIPLRTALDRRSLCETIERLLKIETRNGIGAYYFMMSGPYGVGRFDTRTDIVWRVSREIARLAQDAGMTIGLHGSFRAKERDTYQEEKDRLEQVLGCAVTCHRNHYLRFDTQRICRQLEAAGIEYDFSLGFVSRIGFRAGCGKIYRLFDHVRNQPGHLREVPLLFMDTVLGVCGWAQALKNLRAALEEVKKIHGCVALLFHPELFLSDRTALGQFEEVIGICKELEADLSGKCHQLSRVSPHLINGSPASRAALPKEAA